jgi:hypothetical protein
MRVLVCTLALAIAVAHPLVRPLAAQFPPDVAVGTRLRVALPDSLRQTWPREQWVRGHVAALAVDTLYLRLPGTESPVAIRRSAIKRLDRSLGVPTPVESAFRGAVAWAFVGALYGVLLRTVDAEDWRDRSLGESAALGAGMGAGVGFVLGALFPSERWRRVRLR